jgi:hypothetical protein
VRAGLGGIAWVGSTDPREHEFLVERQTHRIQQHEAAKTGRKDVERETARRH